MKQEPTEAPRQAARQESPSFRTGEDVNRKTFLLANEPGYIDAVMRIYPVKEGAERTLKEEDWRKVSEAYDARDDIALLEALFSLDVFPAKGPDANLLRSKAGGYLHEEPETVKRLAGRIYALGKEELRARCEAPVASSRQLGQAFREWLRKTFEVKDEDEFLEHSRGVCVLAGSDQSLARFACEHLGYGGDKGLDGIIKVNTTYLPLEAKLLSAFGGTQNGQLRDALGIHDRGFAPGVRPLAVVDGQYLMFRPAARCAGEEESIGKYQQMIAACEGPVVSALMLKKLAEGLAREGKASA